MALRSGKSSAAVALGFELDHPDVGSIPFRSSETLLDYDVVFWDPHWILSEYTLDYPSHWQGRPMLSKHDSALVRAETSRRKREMVDLLRVGGTLVVFANVPESVYIYTGGQEFSGTGRNRQTTNFVDSFSFGAAHPIRVALTEAQGSQMEFRGTEPFGAFWREFGADFSYRAFFEKPIGKPQVFVRRTDRAVASVARAEKGWVVYLPDLRSSDSENEQAERDLRVTSGILELIAHLRVGTGDFSLPSWAKQYTLEGELVAEAALSRADRSVERALKKQARARRALAELQQRKLLFTGTGPPLESQVRRAFESLGCVVEDGEDGRADLIVRHGEQVAVVEVKGLSKSAKEANAAQLEKWVSGYYEQEGTQPKAILVVNAFAEEVLDKRVEDPFPDQMIPYSSARAHCLMTGGQLLMASIDASKNPDDAREILDSIFGCVGVWPEYAEWAARLAAEAKAESGKGEPVARASGQSSTPGA